VPDPLSGKPYMTSTQAKYKALNYTGHIEAKEPEGVPPVFFQPYNLRDTEYIKLADQESESDSSDDELPVRKQGHLQLGVRWAVSPDYGEADHSVVGREKDIENGKKASGWTNPLGWSDDGHDDDLVVTQLKA
jgi:hypothetical protein